MHFIRPARFVPLLVLISMASTHAAAPADMSQRVQEMKNLRWGMFICWSFSTFSGKEWTPGVKDLSFFAATGCDTDQWAQTAREANMGYVLFLAKHHDGFCLWDTKTTGRKVTNSPLKRDVLAELKKSCDKHGIKLALYFSEGDWTWPGAVDGQGGKNGGGVNPEMKKAQLKELLTGYGPIEYIWFDHAIGTGGLSHADTIAFVKSIQPGCFVGFNHGDQQGADIRLGELGRPAPLNDPKGAGPYMADAPSRSYLLAEFTYPILPPHQGGAMWFYSLPKHDQLCHPATKLYRDYQGAVKYGNLFSIDIGPDYAGRLRAIDVQTLRTVGRMIRGEIPAPPATADSLSLNKPARASSSWSRDYSADKAFDGDESTRWGAAPDSRSGWIEVDLGRVASIARAVVREVGFPRTESFILEYREGDTWKPLAKGATLGPEKILTFPAVSARFLRLSVLKASEVPTIEEIQFFEK